jgi:hypothetical protein
MQHTVSSEAKKSNFACAMRKPRATSGKMKVE